MATSCSEEKQCSCFWKVGNDEPLFFSFSRPLLPPPQGIVSVEAIMMKAVLIVLLVLVTINMGTGRLVRDDENLVSDGMDRKGEFNVLELNELTTTTVTCEPTYGFLPCTTVVWGQLFLIVVYEVLLSLSGTYISTGSDLFFKQFGTGVFGASLFQMLGMFPQVLLILVIGITGSSDTIQSLAAMSMGMLAGSVIMSLTIIWGCIIAFGSYDLSGTSQTSQTTQTSLTSLTSTSSNSKKKTQFSLTGYGVKTDSETKDTARIMLLSLIPFLLLQLASILTSSSARRVVVLISLIISAVFLIAYCSYQVFQPWIQNRRYQYLMRNYIQNNLLQVLRNRDGKPDESSIKELFHKIDQNNNTQISAAELRAFMLGLQIEEVGLNDEDFVSKVVQEFDVSGDSNVSEEEFVQGLSKWLKQSNVSVSGQTKSSTSSKSTGSTSRGGAKSQQSKSQTSTSSSSDAPVWWNYTKAGFLIIVGTAITSLLAQPLMEVLQEFATDINIPSFLVSYLVIPLATSFRTAFRAIASAREKTESAVSLTLSEIYGGVFMNNVMGLTIFLALVYIRDLSWDVSAEVLVVLIICAAVGLWTSFSSKFPFWTSIVAFSLYPISLAFVYVLTTVLGWG